MRKVTFVASHRNYTCCVMLLMENKKKKNIELINTPFSERKCSCIFMKVIPVIKSYKKIHVLHHLSGGVLITVPLAP